MAITVPRAGTFAGRAAEIRIATPQIGDAIYEFGQMIQTRELQMREEQDQTRMRRTQLDMANDLALARQQIEQTGDPDQIDSQWPEQLQAIRQKYLGPDENGNPRWTPDIADRLDLDLTEIANRHALSLGNRAIDLRQSQQAANWIGMRSDITARAAVADPDTLDAYFAIGDQTIADQLARGTLSPEQAAKEQQALRTDVYTARGRAMIENDPEGFLAATEPGEDGAVGAWGALGENLSTFRQAAKGEIADRQARALKDAEAAATARQTEIGKRLGEMTGLMADGFNVADEAFLNDPEVQANPNFAAARAAQSLRDETPGIRLMTVPELDRQIAAEMARPVAHAYQTERVKLLKKWRDDKAKSANTDFVSMAREAGMAVPDLPDFDPSDPAPFAQGLAARMDYDDWAVTAGQTKTQAILSAEEKAGLAKVMDPKSEVAPKLTLMRSMLLAGQGRLGKLASVTEADPVFNRAARLMADTGDAALAEQMLRGQQKAALGTVNLPTERQMNTVLDEITGGTFDGNAAMKAELMAASRALYADSAAGINPDGASSVVPFMDDEEAQTLFETSVQRALGARPDQSGQLTIGGLQQINDRPVWLPPGTGADDVELAFDSVEDQLRGKVRMPIMGENVYGWDDAQPDPDRLRALRAASVTGLAPDLGIDPASRFRNITLRRVGQSDVYELTYAHNGRIYTVPQAGDATRTAYRFRLSDLMREAAK